MISPYKNCNVMSFGPVPKCLKFFQCKTDIRVSFSHFDLARETCHYIFKGSATCTILDAFKEIGWLQMFGYTTAA